MGMQEGQPNRGDRTDGMQFIGVLIEYGARTKFFQNWTILEVEIIFK
jgi:hypothetical protein